MDGSGNLPATHLLPRYGLAPLDARLTTSRARHAGQVGIGVACDGQDDRAIGSKSTLEFEVVRDGQEPEPAAVGADRMGDDASAFTRPAPQPRPIEGGIANDRGGLDDDERLAVARTEGIEGVGAGSVARGFDASEDRPPGPTPATDGRPLALPNVLCSIAYNSSWLAVAVGSPSRGRGSSPGP